MPQPMKPINGQDFYPDPRCIESRPACAIKMATVAAAWVGVEVTLTRWFSLIVNEPQQSAADTYSIRVNEAFKAALTAIENLHLRIVVIRTAMQDRFNEKQSEEFELIAKELRTRAGERNLVVHSSWVTTDRYPNDILTRENDRWIRYTSQDFELIIQRIEATETKVVNFAAQWVSLEQLFPKPPPTNPPPTS